jgi:hypothetical protein
MLLCMTFLTISALFYAVLLRLVIPLLRWNSRIGGGNKIDEGNRAPYFIMMGVEVVYVLGCLARDTILVSMIVILTSALSRLERALISTLL